MKKFVFIVLLLIAACAFAVRAESQVIVIANSSVKATDVSKSDLRDVFTGASSSLKDGSRVTPVFSGQASMPKSLDGEAAMVEFVAHTPGAIGYLGKATPHQGVKVLVVR
jgi:ABC-type phosphate transport system substrate-binding protein